MIRMLKYLIILSPFFTKGQGLVFSEYKLDEAMKAAQNEDKLIFVDFYASWCGPCKAMESSVFSKDRVGEFYNRSFINLKILTDEKEGNALAKQYGVREFPTYMYLNEKGEIVYKTVGFQKEEKFLKEARFALREKKGFVSIEKLDSLYESGQRELEFLSDYLKRKYEVKGPQPEILTSYLEVLPRSQLLTEKALTLISDNVTTVSSEGFSILAESLYRFQAMTENQQKAVLSGIAQSKRYSFKEAVKKKDDELLNTLIEAVYATSYSREAALAEERQFRYDYAKLTENFKHFSVIAREEAERILHMSDSDFESKTLATIEDFKKNAELRNLSPSSGQYKMMMDGLENGAKKSASFQLAEFAWGYYQMTAEINELNQALRWSAYSIKLHETPANWETYAFLLKKVGRKRDAKRAMKQAVKLARKMGIESGTLKEAYTKIK